MRIGLVVSLLVLVSGCPNSTTQMGDSGAPALDTGVDAGGPCAYVDTIDRTCSTDADCHVGLHQTDCCGSSVMIAFRDTQHGLYASSESACMASYPGCGCPAMLPTTDSGETVTDTSMVLSGCITVGPGGRCETYIANRPPNGR